MLHSKIKAIRPFLFNYTPISVVGILANLQRGDHEEPQPTDHGHRGYVVRVVRLGGQDPQRQPGREWETDACHKLHVAYVHMYTCIHCIKSEI